jgi:hypothetical protein
MKIDVNETEFTLFTKLKALIPHVFIDEGRLNIGIYNPFKTESIFIEFGN